MDSLENRPSWRLPTLWLLALVLAFAHAGCAEESEPEPVVLTNGPDTDPEDCYVGQLCNPDTWDTLCRTAEMIDCSQFLDSYTERTLRPYNCSCVETLPDVWSLRCDPAC